MAGMAYVFLLIAIASEVVATRAAERGTAA